jgi:hypothetical protein
MQIKVRTADRVLNGSLDIDDAMATSTTVGDMLDELRNQWNLDSSGDYFVRNDRSGKQLDPSKSLPEAGVQEGDIVEVVPIIQAG